MNTKILDRSYDLRGVYGVDIDEEFYYKMGFAFALLRKEAEIFYVGYDARLSSEPLKKSLIQGILDAGKDVVDIGLCSTDMIYFATGRYGEADIGMMITASHNPKEYNGLKSCLRNAVPINLKSFGKELMEYMENGDFTVDAAPGNYKHKDITDDFIEHIASFIDVGSLKKLKIVADAGNGVAGVFMSKLADRLGFDLVPLFFEPDGNFPNHHPSPIEPENVQDMIIKVNETGADLGVAFDGDADRMTLVDETGTIWSGTITTAMISKMILEKNPGKKIVYNAVCGNIVPETIEKTGGIPIKEKVGHVYFKEKMNEDEDMIFGGEHSGHYYFRKNWNADSGVIAFAIVLELLSNQSRKPSEIRADFERYLAIPEINFKVNDVSGKIDELKAAFKDGMQDNFDGLTVRYSHWWFNVRPSSNEPLLRLNIEARNQDLLDEKYGLLVDILKS